MKIDLISPSGKAPVLDDGKEIELARQQVALCGRGSEIEGNRGRPQHPKRDHRNQGLGIVADADADIGSRLDAAQAKLARRLCRSGGKPGIGEASVPARSARSLRPAMRKANEGISQVHRSELRSTYGPPSPSKRLCRPPDGFAPGEERLDFRKWAAFRPAGISGLK